MHYAPSGRSQEDVSCAANWIVIVKNRSEPASTGTKFKTAKFKNREEYKQSSTEQKKYKTAKYKTEMNTNNQIKNREEIKTTRFETIKLK